MKKIDYDTRENLALTELNKKVLVPRMPDQFPARVLVGAVARVRGAVSFDDVRFVWLGRDDMQSGNSATLRRRIVTCDYRKRYNREVNNSIPAFLALASCPALACPSRTSSSGRSKRRTSSIASCG